MFLFIFIHSVSGCLPIKLPTMDFFLLYYDFNFDCHFLRTHNTPTKNSHAKKRLLFEFKLKNELIHELDFGLNDCRFFFWEKNQIKIE